MARTSLTLICSVLSQSVSCPADGLQLHSLLDTSMSHDVHASPSASPSHDDTWTQLEYRAPYLSPTHLTAPIPDLHVLQSFDRVASPLISLAVPSKWPIRDEDRELVSLIQTRAQITWNATHLNILYRISGPFRVPAIEQDKMTVMKDSRVECFLFPHANSTHYLAYESNARGLALSFKATLQPRVQDFSWTGHSQGRYNDQPLTLGSDSTPFCLYLLCLPWSDADDLLQHDCTIERLPICTQGARVGIYRGEAINETNYPASHTWSTWIDPLSTEVSFHVAQSFARLVLLPARSD